MSSPGIVRAAVGACLILAACKFPFPADVVDDDAATDASNQIDAPTDARVRPRPLVQNHQMADLVFGQPDFTSYAARPVGPNSLSNGIGIGGNAARVWISDFGMNRVMSYQPFPTANDPAALFPLGRANFTDVLPDPISDHSFAYCWGVVDTGQHLLVVDRDANRVLIWTSIPVQGTEPADLVLGQATMNGFTAGDAAAQLREPTGVWSDGERVVVVDSGNHRVLIWRSFPTSNGQAADIVVGQPAFGMREPPTQASATRLKNPRGVASDGEMLAVADAGHGRVLVWHAFPSANGAPASVAIGQPDLNTATIGTAQDPRSFQNVEGVAIWDGALFVADHSNDRVLVFDPIPALSVSDVSRAQQSLGQPNPTVVNVNQPATDRSLRLPNGLAVIAGYLFVGGQARTVTVFPVERLTLPGTGNPQRFG